MARTACCPNFPFYPIKHLRGEVVRFFGSLFRCTNDFRIQVRISNPDIFSANV